MKGEKLFSALTDIREEYILEAVPKKRPSSALRWCGLAACLALLAGGLYAGLQTGLQTAPTPVSGGETADPSLPMLTIGSTGSSSAMGYEGYLAYDISELTNANPWTEDAVLSTLPVFRNLQQTDETGKVTPFPREQMEQRLTEMAGRLGLENYVITDNSPDEKTRAAIIEKEKQVGGSLPESYFDPTCLQLQGDGLTLETDSTLLTTLRLDPARELSGGPLPHDASRTACEKAAEALLEEYASLLGMEQPVTDISGGDRNIYGEQSFSIGFYEGAGDLTDRILGYHFDRAVFYRDDDGKLFIIRRWQYDLSEKLGDYPIISAKEARELLLDGRYITTVPEEMPGEAYIAKVELVYRTDPDCACFMPYYRFYVGLPGMAVGDMRDYGAYYVPAVEEAYIPDMPLWDGSFN